MLILFLFLIIIILHLLGMQGPYYTLPLYDKFLHFLGGVFVSLIFYKIYFRLKQKKLSFLNLFVMILTVSFFWELHEFIWDKFLVSRYNFPPMQLGLIDTLTDTGMNILGAITLFYLYKKMSLKKYNKVVIFGTFDVIHPGHISVFKYAQKLAKELYIIVARDKNIEKDTNLLFNENQRLENLKKYNITNNIILGDLDNPLAFYNQFKPDLAVLGYDQFKNVNLLKKLPLKIKKAPPFYPELFKSQKIKKIMIDPQASFYLINKEKGCPSFKNISILRKVLNTLPTGRQVKKVGFAGTLDPMASGLLIIATGKATKFLDGFHALNKIYEAQIELGKISDTFDAEGIIKEKNTEIKPTKNEIIQNLKKYFIGTISQTPPIFSAKKIKGKKAYNLARQNKKIKLKPVKININEIKVLKYQYPFLNLKITCSKGTYIRSIANDLGEKLKTGGYLTKLVRTDIGPFNIKNSLEQKNISLSNLEKNKINILNIVTKINNWFLK